MVKPYLKTVTTDTESILDEQTGEIIEKIVRNRKILVNNKEQFLILYAQIEGVLNILTFAELKIMIWLLLHQANQNGMVYLVKSVKLEIAEYKSISLSAVNNLLSKLIKKGMLISRGARSATYLINPAYMWKGALDVRNKHLKYVLELETGKEHDFKKDLGKKDKDTNHKKPIIYSFKPEIDTIKESELNVGEWSSVDFEI